MIVKHSINLSNADSDFFSWWGWWIKKSHSWSLLWWFNGGDYGWWWGSPKLWFSRRLTLSVLKFKESSFVLSQTHLIQTCQWTTEASFTSILSQNKSSAKPRSTTKVLKLFVSSCGAEQKKSEAGAVTETVRKARRQSLATETKKNTKHRSKFQHAQFLSKFSLHKDEALLCTTKKFTPSIESWSIARQGCHIATPGVTSENRAFALRIPGMRTTSMALVTFW